MSAEAIAVPLLPVLSVLFVRFGSGWVAVTVAELSKAPAALIVAVTVIVAFAPLASEAMVQGSATQPPPLTLVMVRFVGVSVTCTFVAVDGPPLATKSVYWIESPAWNGPAVINVLTTETSAEVESGTVLLELFELTPSACAVAVFVTCAFSTSAAVMTYDAVQVIDSPG